MPNIAPNAEYFNTLTYNNQTTKNNKHKGHEVINKKPINPATPLPPLNFNHTGNIWPNIEHMPQQAP